MGLTYLERIWTWFGLAVIIGFSVAFPTWVKSRLEPMPPRMYEVQTCICALIMIGFCVRCAVGWEVAVASNLLLSLLWTFTILFVIALTVTLVTAFATMGLGMRSVTITSCWIACRLGPILGIAAWAIYRRRAANSPAIGPAEQPSNQSAYPQTDFDHDRLPSTDWIMENEQRIADQAAAREDSKTDLNPIRRSQAHRPRSRMKQREQVSAVDPVALISDVLPAFIGGLYIGGFVAYFVLFVFSGIVYICIPSMRQMIGPYGAPVSIDLWSQLLHAIPVGCSAFIARWISKRWTPFSVGFAVAGLVLCLLVALRH